MTAVDTRRAREGELEEALVALVERLRGAPLNRIVDAMMAALQREIPEYGRTADKEILADVRAGSRRAVQRSLQLLIDPQLRALPDVQVARDVGRKRAIEGFPLHAVLRAYHLCARVALEEISTEIEAMDCSPAIAVEMIGRLSTATVRFMQRIGDVITDAYLDAERELTATSRRLATHVFEELLEGPRGDEADLRDRAEAVGYRLGDAHAVATIAIDAAGCGDVPKVQSEAGLKLASTLRGLQSSALRPVVQVTDTGIVVIFPMLARRGDRELLTDAKEAIDGLRLPRGVAIGGGLGRVERGLIGIARSHRQAIMALDAARARGEPFSLVSYVGMLPTLFLMQEQALAEDVARSTVQPLMRHDAEHGTTLVATLEAYLDTRGNVSASATRLHLHRHTAVERLKRVADLTGRDLRRRDDLFLLELGLRGARLRDQPGRSSSDRSCV